MILATHSKQVLSRVAVFAALAVFVCQMATGQQSRPTSWTAEQDHQNMMDQLGIKALRPGPSGNESDPNHANYDASKANPFPNLPDVLTLKDGKKVTTADEWWKQRRPEIEHDMQEYVYGFVPKNAPKVTWQVKVIDHEMVG